MGIAKKYTDEIRVGLELYANYFPNEKLELGDYGKLDGNYFKKLGNIKDKGIDFIVKPNNKINKINYSSKDGIKTKVLSSAEIILPGEVTQFESTIEVSFDRASAIIFKIEDIYSESINNLNDLGKNIINLCKNDDEWDENYKIVSTLFCSKINSIYISKDKGSSLTFKVKGDNALPIGAINLGSLNNEISNINSYNMAFDTSENSEWQTLFRLYGTRTSLKDKIKKLLKQIQEPLSWSPYDREKGINKYSDAHGKVDELGMFFDEEGQEPLPQIVNPFPMIENDGYYFVDELELSKFENPNGEIPPSN